MRPPLDGPVPRSQDGMVEVRPIKTLADVDLAMEREGAGPRRRSLSQTSLKSIGKATDKFGGEALEAAEISTQVGEDNRVHSRQASAIKAMERTGTAKSGARLQNRCSVQ